MVMRCRNLRRLVLRITVLQGSIVRVGPVLRRPALVQRVDLRVVEDVRRVVVPDEVPWRIAAQDDGHLPLDAFAVVDAAEVALIAQSIERAQHALESVLAVTFEINQDCEARSVGLRRVDGPSVPLDDFCQRLNVLLPERAAGGWAIVPDLDVVVVFAEDVGLDADAAR